MKYNWIIILLIAAVGCSKNESPVIEGTWEMHSVIQNGLDVTTEHNPQSDRYISFGPDDSFESGGSPYGSNTGRYTFDHNSSTLFLDSDAGEQDDSRWRISYRSDTMHWSGLGSEWAEGFEIVQVRRNH